MFRFNTMDERNFMSDEFSRINSMIQEIVII